MYDWVIFFHIWLEIGWLIDFFISVFIIFFIYLFIYLFIYFNSWILSNVSPRLTMVPWGEDMQYHPLMNIIFI